MFVSWFQICKMKFHHCWPTPEKMRLPTTWQNPLFPPLEKNFPKPMLLCVMVRASQTFLRMSH